MGIVTGKSIEWKPYLWQQGRPVSPHAIKRVEMALGIRFPDDYRKVVMQHQGEIPEPNLFDFIENGQKTTSVMGALFHFLKDKTKAGFYSYNILENYKKRQHLLPSQVIPFSEDPAGNSIAFDFRERPAEPSIVFVNHESVGEKNWTSPIAGNFSELLNLLHADTGA